MRLRSSLLSLVVAGSLLVACGESGGVGPGTSNPIVGEWVMETAGLKEKILAGIMADVPPEHLEMAKSMSEQMLPGMLEQLSRMYVNVKADGTYRGLAPDGGGGETMVMVEKSGTWKRNAAGYRFTQTGSEDLPPTDVVVKGNVMTIKPEGAPFELTMKRK